MMSHHYKLSRAAELTALGVFRDFIDDACQRENISDDIAFKLKLAVDEASTNVIEHGYKGMDPGSIILSLKFDPKQVRVEITDFGHSFEPSEPPAPNAEAVLEDQSAGGFGLYFIYQTMDHVDYRSSAVGNTLIFTKKL
jgi:anti-sigma regulatory factor (Ser/Thr protein kinase)